MPITPEMFFADNTPDTTERCALIKVLFRDHGKWIINMGNEFVGEILENCDTVDDFAEKFFRHFFMGTANSTKPVEELIPPPEKQQEYTEWKKWNVKDIANTLAEIRKIKYGTEEVKPDELDQNEKNMLRFITGWHTPIATRADALIAVCDEDELIYEVSDLLPEREESDDEESDLSQEQPRDYPITTRADALISLFQAHGSWIIRKRAFIKEYFEKPLRPEDFSMEDFAMKFFQRCFLVPPGRHHPIEILDPPAHKKDEYEVWMFKHIGFIHAALKEINQQAGLMALGIADSTHERELSMSGTSVTSMSTMTGSGVSTSSTSAPDLSESVSMSLSNSITSELKPVVGRSHATITFRDPLPLGVEHSGLKQESISSASQSTLSHSEATLFKSVINGSAKPKSAKMGSSLPQEKATKPTKPVAEKSRFWSCWPKKDKIPMQQLKAEAVASPRQKK